MSSEAKVLFVTPRICGGGAEAHMLLLAEKLRERSRLQIHVAVMLSSQQVSEEFIALSPLSKSYPSSFRAVTSLFALRKLIKELQPRAIYSCLEWSNILVGLLKVAGEFNFQWIAGLQNPLSARSLNRNLKGSLGRYQLHDYLLKRADTVVVPTSGLASELKASLLAAEKVLIIPNITEVTNPPTKAVTVGVKRRLKLGFCARLVEQKDPLTLLRIFNRLCEDYPVELHIVGDGPLMAQMKKFCSSVGISERVVFHGQLSKPWDVLSDVDLFLLTSRFEGFGNVIVEAMSYAKPIVAFDVAYGPRELIIDNENGFLIPSGDELRFEEKVRGLLDDPELCRRFSEKSLQHSQRFSSEKNIVRFEEIL